MQRRKRPYGTGRRSPVATAIFPPISSWAPALHRRFADQQGILRYARVFHRGSQQAVTIGGAAAKHCEFPLQSLTPETTYRYVAKGNGVALATAQLSTLPQIQTVFIILMENHSWSAVKSAPYIAHLAATGAHAENYRTPIHPSEPNYVILEAGTNCPPLADGTAGHCFTTDGDPTGSNHTASPFRLVRYL